jgi:hypothetical protein
VLVVGLAPGAADTDFQNARTGLAASIGVALEATTVSGTAVWTGSNANGSVATYRAGDTVVLVVAPASSQDSSQASLAITKALLAAST